MGFVGLDVHRGEGQDSRIGKNQRQRHIGGVGDGMPGIEVPAVMGSLGSRARCDRNNRWRCFNW